MRLIVGLGNPGPKYDRTRHNVGFVVCDELIRFDQNRFVAGKGPFQITEKPFQNGKGLVVKPTSFMNESGRAVQAALDQFHVAPEQCLVVVDDVNLPVGSIRFRSKGSAGGHHGLESIIAILGTSNFPRLRIGVGNGDLSGKDLTDYVLGKFTKEERDLLVPQISQARDACLKWLKGEAEQVAQHPIIE